MSLSPAETSISNGEALTFSDQVLQHGFFLSFMTKFPSVLLAGKTFDGLILILKLSIEGFLEFAPKCDINGRLILLVTAAVSSPSHELCAFTVAIALEWYPWCSSDMRTQWSSTTVSSEIYAG